MKDTLFYDGLCPLCQKEINLLKRLIAEKVNFSDIHLLEPKTENPSIEILLRRLHLKKANGDWLVGLDANIHIWSYTRYGKLLKPLRWSLLRKMSDTIYNRWADRRFKKSYDCLQCLSNS